MREQWGRRGCWPAAHMPPQGWAPAVPGTYQGNRPPAAPQNRSRAQGDAAQRLPFLPPSNLVYLVVAEINSAPNWELGAAAANPGRTQAPLPRSPPHQQNPAAADFEVGVVTLERAAPPVTARRLWKIIGPWSPGSTQRVLPRRRAELRASTGASGQRRPKGATFQSGRRGQSGSHLSGGLLPPRGPVQLLEPAEPLLSLASRSAQVENAGTRKDLLGRAGVSKTTCGRHRRRSTAAAGGPGAGWVRPGNPRNVDPSFSAAQEPPGPHKDFADKLIKGQPNELKENSLNGACCASENSCHVYLFKFNGIFVAS